MASATYTNSKNNSAGATTGEVYKPGDNGFYARDINYALKNASTNKISQTVSQKPLKDLGFWEATLQGDAVVIKNGNWTVRNGTPEVLEANLDLWSIFTGKPDELTFSRLVFSNFDVGTYGTYVDVCVYIMPFNEAETDIDGICKDPATYLSQWSQNAPTVLKFAIGREVDDKDIITSTVEHRRICTIRLTSDYAGTKYIPTKIVNHVVNDIFMDNGAKFPWENLNFGYTLSNRTESEVIIPTVIINSGYVRLHGLRTYELNETEIDLSGSDVFVFIEINRIYNTASISSQATLPESSSNFLNLPLYHFQKPLGSDTYILNRILHMGDFNFDTPIR